MFSRKKLVALVIDDLSAINNNNFNTLRNKIDEIEAILKEETIYNYSKRELNAHATSALNKGLKFGIKNRKIDIYEILHRFEELAQSMDWIQIKNTYNDPLRANLNNKNAFLQNLQKLAIEFIELSKQTFDNLTDEEHQALKTLSQDKTIVISKADKDNAKVIQDLEVYRLKLKEILQQDGKF